MNLRPHRRDFGDEHVPDAADDQDIARAIHAIESAETFEDFRKLSATAQRAQWKVLARYARGNRARLDRLGHQIRVIFAVLGVMLILIGLLTNHNAASRHADTVNEIARVKVAVVTAADRGFYDSALAACRRLDGRNITAQVKLPQDAAIFAIADPYDPNCARYARQQVKTLGLKKTASKIH